MVTAKPRPRPLFAGLLILAALIVFAAMTLNNTLAPLRTTIGLPHGTQSQPRPIISTDPAGPMQPAPSVRSQDGVQSDQGSDQPATGASRGITRFADGDPVVVVAPASAQSQQTCVPKCPPKPAR